jgi:hypothetical protein
MFDGSTMPIGHQIFGGLGCIPQRDASLAGYPNTMLDLT